MNIKRAVKQILIRQQNKKYDKALSCRRVTYQDWLLSRKACSSCGIREAGKDFVVLCLEEGQLAEDAMLRASRFFREHPDTVFIYGDEDCVDEEGQFHSPWFKPDWSPDLLDSCLYFGSHIFIAEKIWIRYKDVIAPIVVPSTRDEQVFFVTDAEQYEKWLHECIRKEAGYKKGSRAVGHISDILFHAVGKDKRNSYLTKSEYLRNLEEGSAKNGSMDNKLVSVIIPSKDNPALLTQCIEALQKSAKHMSFELIVVDNGSKRENEIAIRELLSAHTYLYCPMEFNFSKMCNIGAKQAKGEILLFLNDDVILGELCFEKMVAYASRDYTGAVGIKLYYPNGRIIQHAGITNLPMGPVHKLQFKEDIAPHYFDANKGARNCLAVTAACLMVSRDKFEEIGGFSEQLRVAFNDVDLCFKLYECGYHNVCLNDVNGWHHESISRGNDEAEDKLNRLLQEREKLYEMHPSLEGVDPYYSIHLGRDCLDTGIRPAYETAGNKLQKAGIFKLLANTPDCKRDDCLLLRVESFTGDVLTGYGIVLGDNNACYERQLLLIKTEGSGLYNLSLEGQYRPDLEENLPDQERVALCGYRVLLEPGCIPPGSYRVGMIARNKVSGLKLLQITNRVITLRDGD